MRFKIRGFISTCPKRYELSTSSWGGVRSSPIITVPTTLNIVSIGLVLNEPMVNPWIRFRHPKNRALKVSLLTLFWLIIGIRDSHRSWLIWCSTIFLGLEWPPNFPPKLICEISRRLHLLSCWGWPGWTCLEMRAFVSEKGHEYTYSTVKSDWFDRSTSSSTFR